jgi:prophage regulatory protein
MLNSNQLIGLVRLKQIVGDSKANPVITPIIPISRSAWCAGVKSGKYPQPVRVGPRTVAWRLKDIMVLIDSLEAANDVA